MARSNTMRLSNTSIARLRPRDREYTVWDAQVSGLGVRVRPTGYRGYVYLVRTSHGTRRLALDPVALNGIDDVRRQCLEIAAVAAGGGRLPETANGSGRLPMTFADFVAGPWREARYRYYKPSTRQGVDSVLRRQLLAAFGRLTLDHITGSAVMRWFDSYSRTSPGGANSALKTLKQIMNHAIATGFIRNNPARHIRSNPRPRLTRFLSRDEVRRLHEALDKRAARRPSCLPTADIIRLLLLTGCRRGEILQLRWQEVDSERHVLNLTDSKTGPRTVWLSAAAQRILACQPKTTNPLVFPSPRDAARPRRDIDSFWFSVRRAAGIEDVRLHDLRHTFASHAVLRGVSLPAVSRILGHKNASMTLRYAHVGDRDVEAAAERIGAAISRLISDPNNCNADQQREQTAHEPL